MGARSAALEALRCVIRRLLRISFDLLDGAASSESGRATFWNFIMPNALLGVRVKIDRAKKHLADLHTAIAAFEGRKPHTVVMEIDRQSGYELYRFHERETIPLEWGAIVGDCIHNLRSALDLLANDLVRDNGGTTTKYTAFPIGSNKTYFHSSGITKVKGASAAAIKLIERLKPYQGGNKTLLRLHEIDIADKHLLLIPVAAAHGDFGFRHELVINGVDQSPPSPWYITKATDRKFPLKNGDELIAYQRRIGNFEDKTDFHFAFEIAFGEGQIFDGDAVIPTLHQLIQFTERLIDIFARHIFGLTSW
jgi:hypothetical protein